VPRQISHGNEALSRGRADPQPVWDLPVRLFHWLIAALVAFSWWSVTYNHTRWHIWSGLTILALLIFRLLWGLVGSSTARFAKFIRGPRTIRLYLCGRWSGVGHNPLGALSVIALLLALAVQVGLGLFAQDEDGIFMGPLAHLVSSDTSDRLREIHGINFYVLLGLIVLHVAAVLFYRLRMGKHLTKPMITGRALLDPGAQPMQPGKSWIALICLALALAITGWVAAGAPPLSPP
jgi:cytochrome b